LRKKRKQRLLLPLQKIQEEQEVLIERENHLIEQKADIIIRNDGTTAELGRKIRFLLAIFHLIPGRRTHV